MIQNELLTASLFALVCLAFLVIVDQEPREPAWKDIAARNRHAKRHDGGKTSIENRGGADALAEPGARHTQPTWHIRYCASKSSIA